MIDRLAASITNKTSMILFFMFFQFQFFVLNLFLN